MKFFGERWDAPAFDDAEEVPTPVGSSCLTCGEPILMGESGITMPAYLNGGVSIEPMHIECHLRQMLGCVAHLEERCSCHGGDEHDGFDREAARAVMRWVQARRRVS